MKDYITQVVANRPVAENIWEMTLLGEKLEEMRCGQFLHLEVPGFLLRRPFGIYKFDSRTVSLVYAVVGNGTETMTKLKTGDEVKVTLPLGNGFWLDDNERKVVLLGGGMGCVPLASVPITYTDREFYAFLGFADKSKVAFTEEFEKYCDTTVCTDNGSFGVKGYPTAALEKRIGEIRPDVILTCGPRPMLKGVKAFADKHGIKTFASMEERMGCGVGACLVCACKVKQKDGSTVSRRVCADGPVFDIKELEL